MDYHASIVAYDIHGFSALCIYSTVLGVFGDFVAVIYVSVTYPGVDFRYKAPVQYKVGNSTKRPAREQSG